MLQANHLRKTFGHTVAVDDVSFEVEDGKILGLIGRNGSGKTTIFRLILNFLTPEGKGEVLWNGKPMGDQLYNIVGYLPEERGLSEKLTIENQIFFLAQLRGMRRKQISERLDIWLDKFQVKGKRKDKISTLSKGNQQKVQLIAALIHEPKFLILDEPFSGLDPVNADLLKEGIRYLKEKGSAIIFSSHDMNNVSELCDNLIMINDGVRVLYGSVHDVRDQFGETRLEIETPDWTLDELMQLEGVTDITMPHPHYFKLILSDAKYGKEIFSKVSNGQYLKTFIQHPPTLEEIFKMKAGEKHE